MAGLATFAAVGLQAGIVALLVESLRRGSGAAAVNATVALSAALAPYGLAIVFGPSLADPILAVWVAIAGFLHTVGMLGPYESVWWWDHLTHAVSASLVGALVYAALVAVAGFDAMPAAVITVGGVLGVGIAWELLELAARAIGERYGIQPVLVHYGWRDTALDLVFDVIGVGCVVVLDLRVFIPVVERFAMIIA